jgi:hypothetical protein
VHLSGVRRAHEKKERAAFRPPRACTTELERGHCASARLSHGYWLFKSAAPRGRFAWTTATTCALLGFLPPLRRNVHADARAMCLYSCRSLHRGRTADLSDAQHPTARTPSWQRRLSR